MNAPWRTLEPVIELPAEVAGRLEERVALGGLSAGGAIASVLISILSDR